LDFTIEQTWIFVRQAVSRMTALGLLRQEPGASEPDRHLVGALRVDPHKHDAHILRKKIEDLRQLGGAVLEGAAVEGVAIIEVPTAPTPCRW
jgi:hypothetical protein